MKKKNSINFWTNVSIKLIHRAYLFLTVGHEELGSSGSSPQSDRRALINFSHKTSNRSRKWTFSIGYWRMRIYILIKAKATIRNFTVLFYDVWTTFLWYRDDNVDPGPHFFSFFTN